MDLDLLQHQVALVDQEEVAVVPLQEAHNLVDLLYLAKVIMVVVVILLEILFIVLVVVAELVQLEEVDLQVVLEQAVREKM